MASEIGWIDFSPNHRNRVRKFLDLMGAGGIMDELGVGVIRNGMSNRIFPGFSTLYTRAKYFFITPYILLEQQNSNSRMEKFAKAEHETNRLIIDYYLSHPAKQSESYFGKDKKDGKLKRMPSEVYWAGITAFQLVDSNGSKEQMLSAKKSVMEELL